MPWEETSSGRFERQLDPSEDFFRYFHAIPRPPGRERLALTSVAKFKTNLDPQEIRPALRQAWKQMRHQFPALAVTLEQDKKVYQVPSDEAAVESWLDETVIIEPQDADPDDLIAKYVSHPLPKLHYLPGSSQIMIRMSHWRTDGVGVCLFTNHFFAALANPRNDITFGSESKRLPLSIEEAAEGTSTITPEKMDIVRAKWDAHQSNSRPAVLLPQKPFAPARGTLRKTHVFSEKTTSAIVAACKARGVTVTTALAAALGLTIRAHDPRPAEEKNKDMRLPFLPAFNLRPFMPASFISVDHPLSIMIVGEPLSIDVPAVSADDEGAQKRAFDASLQQVGPFYASNTSAAGGAELVSLASAWNQLHVDVMTAPPDKRQPPPPGTSSLNSMGVLDRYIDTVHITKETQKDEKRQFEIEEFYFAVEILGPGIPFYAWTFKGRMRLSAYYNEVSYDGEFVQSVLNDLKRRLCGGLGVVEEAE